MSEEDRSGKTKSDSIWITGLKVAYFAALLIIAVPNIIYGLVAYEYHQVAQQRVEDLRKAAEEEQSPGRQLPPGVIAADHLLARSETDYKILMEYRDLVERGRARVLAAGESEDDGDVLASARPELQSAYEELQRAYEEAVRSVSAAPPADDTSTAIAAHELGRLERIRWFGAALVNPTYYTGLPNWALVPIVTVLAGVLGSVIFVVQAILRTHLDYWRLTHLEGRAGRATGTARYDRKPRVWPLPWFFLRPLLGVVTALGAYVTAQVGLLGAELFTAETLQANAYFMVFVGLIAGLLAWQMIDFIEYQGERLLGSKRRPAWGYGLEAALAIAAEDDDQDPRDIAEKIAEKAKVHRTKLEAWAALRAPATYKEQKRVAGALETEPQLLFFPRAPWESGAPVRAGVGRAGGADSPAPAPQPGA